MAPVATGLTVRTWARNRSYASEQSVWEDTVEKVPDNARALTTLAGLYRDEAFRGVAPENREALLNAALALADRAVALAPDYGTAFTRRGEIRLAFGDREGARADFDRAIEIFPSEPLAYYNRGRMLHGQDPAGADADYTMALEVGPGFVVAAINRGTLRLSQGMPELALADFEHVVRYRPDHAMGWANRGVVLERLGRREEAISSHEKALALYRASGHQPGAERESAAIERLGKGRE